MSFVSPELAGELFTTGATWEALYYLYVAHLTVFCFLFFFAVVP